MIEVIVKKGARRTRVLLYDDIDQLPVTRFNKANKYWMLHDNIGSDIQDFDKNHFNKLALLAGEKDKLIAELNNFRILVFNVMHEVNVQHLSFAVLVHSVDGKPNDDLSEGALKDLLTQLSDKGLTNEVVKKNLHRQGRQSIIS